MRPIDADALEKEGWSLHRTIRVDKNTSEYQTMPLANVPDIYVGECEDTISRQAAIDAINHICPVDTEYDCTLLDWVDVRYVLSDLPSAQPEIIHCKDCKHRYVDGENVRFNVCELNHNKVQSDDWYCADAERWDDDKRRSD